MRGQGHSPQREENAVTMDDETVLETAETPMPDKRVQFWHRIGLASSCMLLFTPGVILLRLLHIAVLHGNVAPGLSARALGMLGLTSFVVGTFLADLWVLHALVRGPEPAAGNTLPSRMNPVMTLLLTGRLRTAAPVNVERDILSVKALLALFATIISVGLLIVLWRIFLFGDTVQAEEFAKPVQAPTQRVDLRSEILRRGIEIRDQGATRQTCSVFAMTFLLEWACTGPKDGLRLRGHKCNDLSEEYLNHMANVATGRTDDGDFFENIDHGFTQYGIIPESALPYDKDKPYDFSKTSIPSSLIEEGKRFLRDMPPVKGRFIKEWSKENPGLTDAQFNEILDCLRHGIPVAIGRDHSMVAVGFEQDKTQTGGGRFILRDSRGKGSGDQGYCMESFESLKKTTFDAFIYEKTERH
jgi:hypothetical protein